MIIKLDKDLNLISTKVLIGGVPASRINAIKIVPYGKNILVGLNVIPEAKVSNFND